MPNVPALPGYSLNAPVTQAIVPDINRNGFEPDHAYNYNQGNDGSFYDSLVDENSENGNEGSSEGSPDGLVDRRLLKGGGGSSSSGGGRSSGGSRSGGSSSSSGSRSGSGSRPGTGGRSSSSLGRSYGNRFVSRSGQPGALTKSVSYLNSAAKSLPRRSAGVPTRTGKTYIPSRSLNGILTGFRTPSGSNFAGRPMGLSAYRSSGLYGYPYMWWYGGALYMYVLSEQDHDVHVVVDGVDCLNMDLNQDLDPNNADDENAQLEDFCRLGLAAAADSDVTQSDDPDGVGFVADQTADIDITSRAGVVTSNGKFLFCITMACSLLMAQMMPIMGNWLQQ